MLNQVNAHCQSRHKTKSTNSFSVYMNLSQDVLFLSSRFLVDNDDRGGLSISIPACLEERKVHLLIALLASSVIKKIAYLVLTAMPSHGLPGVYYKGELFELFTALKRVHFHAHRSPIDIPRICETVKRHLQHIWNGFDAEPPRVSHHQIMGLLEQDTLIWLVVSGVIYVEADGIRKVEWGRRKDLWVPRAKNGSGTLQKIV